jgi:DnaA-homolog protein
VKQLPLAIGPEAEPTFDSYRPGDNTAVLEHLRQLQRPAAPVYLWGSGGTGKTHLLQGLAAHWRAGGQTAGWFDAQDPTPWELNPAWTLVLLDRCEALDAAAQQAAFVLFEEATAQRVQFVAAGRLPPVDLPLRDDLRTRLAWGHVFALRPLPDAETRAALRREADRRGIFLSDEVMGWLLARFERDLGHLMRLLDQLDGYGLARGRKITVPLVREMLAGEGLHEQSPEAPPA